MIRIICEGFMLGLSAGVYCVGACLVFFMPYLLVEGKARVSENLKKLLLFMLGRLGAYIAFAIVIGFVGTAYRSIFTVRFSSACLVAASCLMLIYTLSRRFGDFGFCRLFVSRFGPERLPFFLGLLTGLSPCPPFLVGAARLWVLNNIFGGVVLFIAFFLGTSVYMIPLVFAPCFSQSERIKHIALMVAMLSGLWFLFTGMAGLMP